MTLTISNVFEVPLEPFEQFELDCGLWYFHLSKRCSMAQHLATRHTSMKCGFIHSFTGFARGVFELQSLKSLLKSGHCQFHFSTIIHNSVARARFNSEEVAVISLILIAE